MGKQCWMKNTKHRFSGLGQSTRPRPLSRNSDLRSRVESTSRRGPWILGTQEGEAVRTEAPLRRRRHPFAGTSRRSNPSDRGEASDRPGDAGTYRDGDSILSRTAAPPPSRSPGCRGAITAESQQFADREPFRQHRRRPRSRGRLRVSEAGVALGQLAVPMTQDTPCTIRFMSGRHQSPRPRFFNVNSCCARRHGDDALFRRVRGSPTTPRSAGIPGLPVRSFGQRHPGRSTGDHARAARDATAPRRADRRRL